jgi:tetratricopeptide (TPR) repeat protein
VQPYVSDSMTVSTMANRQHYIRFVIALAVTLLQTSCSRDAAHYLNVGKRNYDQGKYAEAAINFRKSAQKDPNSAEVHYRLGLVELMRGNAVTAYQELRQGLQLAPARDDIRIKLADVALNGYRDSPQRPKFLYDQVTGTADYLLKNNPNSFDGLRLRADVLSIDGRLDEALSTYRRANAVRPWEPGVIYPMIQVMFRLRQTEEAEHLARGFLQVHKDVGRVYDVLLNQYLLDKQTAQAEDLLKLKAANMPKDAGPLLELASFYNQMHRPQEMSQTLSRILNDKGVFPRGHAIVGDFYTSQGKRSEALNEYRAGLSVSKKDRTFYQKKIAKVLIFEGKSDDAIEQLGQVLKADSEDSDSRLGRAMLLRQSSDPKKLELAVSELNSLTVKDPNNEITHYNLGLAYLAKGDSNSAKGQLKESARLRPAYIAPRKMLAEIDQRERNYGETIRLTSEILAVNPNDADTRLLHAAALLGSNARQQARDELDALLRQHPDATNVNLHMAVLDTEEKKYREAEARYRQIYKPGDKDLRPLEGLIQLYIVEQQPDKALLLLQRELEQSPDSRTIHLLLASLATRTGKLDVATQQYRWLQSNDPKSPEVYASLGEFYQLKGDLNSALSSYQKARDLVPSDPKILAVIAFLQNESGREAEAIVNLQKQLALDPQDTVAMNNLAFMLADTSTDLDRALILAQTAQRKAPNNAGIADTVGWVYVKKGLNDSAIQIFNGLVKRFPDQPAFRYHLGVALLQKGEAEEAKSEFVISLSKNPPKDMAEKIKQILSKLG